MHWLPFEEDYGASIQTMDQSSTKLQEARLSRHLLFLYRVSSLTATLRLSIVYKYIIRVMRAKRVENIKPADLSPRFPQILCIFELRKHFIFINASNLFLEWENCIFCRIWLKKTYNSWKMWNRINVRPYLPLKIALHQRAFKFWTIFQPFWMKDSREQSLIGRSMKTCIWHRGAMKLSWNRLK